MEVSVLKIWNISKLILTRKDVPESDADVIADSIIYANSREKHTHGINRLPLYVQKIDKGLLNPRTPMELVSERPVVSVYDANHGFGQVSATKGMHVATEKALTYGVGMVGVRNSNNFGTAGFVAEIATARELIGIVLANSSPAIAPWGGSKPLLGTNPLGIAFPTQNGNPPIVLDMATAIVARGKIRLAAKNNEKIPLGWAIGPDGKPTDDPVKALQGSVLPVGEYKGYGLSLVIDVVAGLLTGAAFGGSVRALSDQEGYSASGHMLIAINIEHFMERIDYYKKIDKLISNVKSSGSDDNLVFLPGEMSFQKTQKNELTIDIPQKQVDEINALAKKLDIPETLEPCTS